MRKMKFIVAVFVLVSMLMQAFVPAMAEPEAEVADEFEVYADMVDEYEMAFPESTDAIADPEGSDDSGEQEDPADTEVIVFSEDVEALKAVDDLADSDAADADPEEDTIFQEETEEMAEEAAFAQETGEAGDAAEDPENYDVSDPDPSLFDYYNEPPAIDTSDPAWENSSIRGLNLSNKEPVELKGYNFVLFGLSGHWSGDDNRSDTIMIITVDPDKEEIKLTSILRDTKAAIEGHEPQKINAAYKYGGAELALDTINRNFSLALDQYVTVNFQTLEDIVDLLGGIEIELTEEEMEFINAYSTEPVTEGLNTLNGEQALLYSRIRKIDSDTVRAGRQQRVIQEILGRLKGSSLLNWLKVLIKVIETSEISIPILDVIKVISLPLSSYKLVNNIVPDIEYEKDLTSMIDEHGEWVWVYDLESAGERIVDIINNQ